MPKITALYAWVVADKDEDDEGVPAVQVGDNVFPLMGADDVRADFMRPYAQALANNSGKTMKLIKSSAVEVVEVITPQPEVEKP